MKKLSKILFIFIMMFAFVVVAKAEAIHTIPITKKIVNVDTAQPGTYHYTLAVKQCGEEVANCVNYTGTLANQYTLTVAGTDTPNSSGIIEVTGNYDISSMASGFATLGDYYFTLTETESGNSYDIMVMSRMDASGQTWTVLQSGFDGNGNKTNIEFVEQPTAKLTLSKTVTGDLGNPNETFTFNIVLADGDNANAIDSRALNKKTTKADNSVTNELVNISASSKTITVTLKHGESIELSNLNSGWKYTITETGATEYNTYIDSSTSNNKVTAQKTLSNTDSRNATSYTNNRESTTPTGIILNVLPFVLLVVIAITGAVLIRKKVNA